MAEDTVSLRSQGTDTGEIGFDGTNVTYGGVAIGTVSGGAAGADLSISFNAAATSAAVDALIQNLTYANSSDTPTSSRDLFLNVRDALGDSFVETSFARIDGAAKPFDSVYVVSNSTPSFVDLDGDGDLDVVVRDYVGTLHSFENKTPHGAEFTVLITPENDAPTIAGDQVIAVLEGGSVVLTSADFTGTDADHDVATLTYTISGLVVGAVQVDGASVTSFTGAQLAAGSVRYVHDGSETTAGAFDVTAADAVGLSSAIITVTATVQPENDAPTATVLPSTLRGTEDAPLNVDLSGVQFSDPENDILALRLTASEGRIDLGTATSGVTVSQTGTATAALYGTTAALEAYLQTVNAVQYTGAQDVFGDAAATLTLTVSDGDAETIAGVISIDLADAVDSQTAVDGENHLIGGAGQDILTGPGGNDVIRGNAGADVLSGGEGRDKFVFRETGHVDKIVDFSVSDGDVLRLDGRHFSTLEAGELQKTQFRINTTGLAETEDDAIIYNSTTGQMYYDVDGSGRADAIEFAVLENLELIDHSDIFIF